MQQSCIPTQQSWVIPEIHHIGNEGTSSCSLHLTKAAKAMQLHTSSIYQQNTQKNNQNVSKISTL